MSSHPLPQVRVVRTGGQLVAPPPAPGSQEPNRLGGLGGRLLASVARVDYRGLLRAAFHHAIDLRRGTGVAVLMLWLLLQVIVTHYLGPEYTRSPPASPW